MHAPPRLVLTRSPEDNAALRALLTGLGLEIVERPALELQYVTPDGDLLERLREGTYDAATFLSRHAVRGLLSGRTLPAPSRLVAIGLATKAELEAHGWRGALMPSEARAEVAAREPDELVPNVRRVLHVRGEIGTTVLQQSLRERGVQVDELVVYRTAPVAHPPLPTSNGPTLVIVASPEAARHATIPSAEYLAIGRSTAQACEVLELTTHVAAEATAEGLAAGVRAWLSRYSSAIPSFSQSR